MTKLLPCAGQSWNLRVGVQNPGETARPFSPSLAGYWTEARVRGPLGHLDWVAYATLSGRGPVREDHALNFTAAMAAPPIRPHPARWLLDQPAQKRVERDYETNRSKRNETKRYETKQKKRRIVGCLRVRCPGKRLLARSCVNPWCERRFRLLMRTRHGHLQDQKTLGSRLGSLY